MSTVNLSISINIYVKQSVNIINKLKTRIKHGRSVRSKDKNSHKQNA